MSQPKLSIGLPVHNGERYLAIALDALLGQDFKDFELIISDNASTDRTHGICQAYARRDARIRYFRSEANRGAAWNFRRVFELAEGQYFIWAAHDDVHLPGLLRRCVELLDRAPLSVVLVAPGTEIVDDSGKRVAQDGLAERLETRRAQPHERVADVLRTVRWATAHLGVYRSEALKRTRLIDRFHACDYVLLLETALLGEIWSIPEILFQKRFHADASTRANATRAEILRWFDPGRRARFLVLPRFKIELTPRLRLAREYARSIARMPLTRAERRRCLFTAGRIWFSTECRRLARTYARRLRRKFCQVVQLAAVLVRPSANHG